MEIDEALFEIFRTEVLGYLETLSDSSAGLVDKMEAAHGLKGAASMLGFQELADLAASLEAELREGDTSGLEESVAAIQVAFRRIEEARAGASQDQRGGAENLPESSANFDETKDELDRNDQDQETAGLEALQTQGGRQEPEPSGETWDEETAAMLRQVFREEASEHFEYMHQALETLTVEPSDAPAIHTFFRAAHTLKGAAGTVGMNLVGRAAHALENVLEAYRDAGRLPEGAHPVLRRALDLLAELTEAPPDESERLLVRLTETLAQAPRPGTPSGQQPDAQVRTTKRAALYEPLPERRRGDRRLGGRRRSDRATVRLPIEEVDSLLDLLVEFIFLRTRIHRRAEEMGALVADLARTHAALRKALVAGEHSDIRWLVGRLSELEVELSDELSNFQRAAAGFTEEADQISQLSSSFQERLLRLRMEPVAPLMSRLARAARTAAAELGRELDVAVTGEDTLLDRAVADRLVDALVHLVRNAVAHGIEPPEERLGAGKPRHGTILLEARQEGDFVLLKVGDDGRGIQWDRVARRAVEQGLVSSQEASELSRRRLLQLIFQPGFSTSHGSDAVSGRGVGLDVVQTEVSAMGGEVSVETTPGQGTLFTLRLPILAAISTALLFKAGGDVYALSLAHVGETCLIARSELEQTAPTAKVSGERLPVLDLVRLFGRERKARGRFVPGFLVRWERDRFVLACDKIVGPRQIVVRPMSPLLQPLPFFCGATVSGSGKVQLVLDPASLAQALIRMPQAAVGDESHAPRILVVDDSRSIREVLSRTLQEAGYDVETATDGWDAWERAMVTNYDILLVDLEMPRLDGYGLTQRLRRTARFADTPILVVTSRTGEDSRKRAEAAGASDFLTKPVKKALVLKTLAEHLPSEAVDENP